MTKILNIPAGASWH